MCQLFPKYATAGSLFLSMLVTTPMGCSYSMNLADVFMQRSNEKAYAEILHENASLYVGLQSLRELDAAFLVTPGHPHIILILKDQVTITCGWTNALVRDYYIKLRCTLTVTCIPISWKKSSTQCNFSEIEMPISKMLFIGNIFDLVES